MIGAGPFFFFKNNFVYLFILVALDPVLSAWAFSSCGEWGLLSGGSVWASLCGVFLCCRAQTLCMGFSSFGIQAQ